MEHHHGQTIERIIRRNGYSITELARLTSVNRRSVYNWFNQRHLKPEIIYRIGSVINYDFASVFPALYLNDDAGQTNQPSKTSTTENQAINIDKSVWKDKYIELLERYNELLVSCIERNVNPDQD